MRAAAILSREPSGVVAPGAWPGTLAEARLLGIAVAFPPEAQRRILAVGLGPHALDLDTRPALAHVVRTGEPVPEHLLARLALRRGPYASWLDASRPWMPANLRDVEFSFGRAMDDLFAEVAPALLRFAADDLERERPRSRSIELGRAAIRGAWDGGAA